MATRGRDPLQKEKFDLRHAIVYKRSLNAVRTILNQGRINIDTKINSQTHNRPLHLAADSGKLDIVHFLLDRGARVDVQDKDGRTPLHQAMIKYSGPVYDPSSYEAIIRLLITRGASWVIKDKRGNTPLDYALTSKATIQIVGDIFNVQSYKKGRRFTESTHPFHILVLFVWRYPNDAKVNGSRKLTNIVDHIKRRFNINETHPSMGKPIKDLEKIIDAEHKSRDKMQSRIKRLQDLHSILVSRGAQTTSGKFSTRNPRRSLKQSRYVTQWTNENYRNIQNSRRGKSKGSKKIRRINRYLTQVFRDTLIRAPVVPRKFSNQKYLYRGVHGPQKNKYLKNGEYEDDGYIAWTRSLDIANLFKHPVNSEEPGIILRISLSEIPRGTGWIWFEEPIRYEKKGKNTFNSKVDEAEVLLPPGKLVITGKVDNMYTVRYYPKNVPSLNGKRMYRNPVQNTRRNTAQNASKNVATTWFSTLFNTTQSSPRANTYGHKRKRIS